MAQNPEIQKILDLITADNPQLRYVLSASNHLYDCRCEQCLQWWVSVGPEDLGDKWGYGPFSEAEYVAAGGVVPIFGLHDQETDDTPWIDDVLDDDPSFDPFFLF